jgi:phosphoribosylglycinamide formyltransferase-1
LPGAFRLPRSGFCRIDSADGAPVPCGRVNARVAVLASGAGTNLQALLDDVVVGSRVSVVISDRAAAEALRRAESRGVHALYVDPSGLSSSEYDLALLERLRDADVDIVCLAGFMRILSPPLVRAFEGRMLNIHPSLLPAFPGAHAVRDALAWGAKVSGATVHLVDEEVDHGPIVLQEAVPVRDGDEEPALHARIQEVEHRLYPLAVRLLIEERLVVEGRRVRIKQGADR